MASLSKRSQARNEKALQDLIKTVPGNDRCADCGARNPGWASWSLGIFLCMRCASLHRKLGTHISKVKSLSMDSWSNEQVDNMKRNGNQKTNRIYNPQNNKPPMPLDVDEIDAVLERFIRQKYDQQSFMSGNPQTVRKSDTGSTRTSDNTPPLPPKPARRFGFSLRSASSAVPLRFNGPSSPPCSPRSPPTSSKWGDEPIRVNKQSRVFGATVGGNNDDSENKFQLRDMGFLDEKRNANVLKGLGGNLEKTIEQLARLGECSAPNSRSRTPNESKDVVVSQSTKSNTIGLATTNGLSLPASGSLSRPDTGFGGQQGSHSAGLPQQQAVSRSSNPSNSYDTQMPTVTTNAISTNQQDGMSSVDEAFWNMQISQQPLFPNATGGYPIQPPHIQNARLQTMTPPVPQLQHGQTNPYSQHMQPPNGVHDPFIQLPQQPSGFAPKPYFQSVAQEGSGSSYNPFLPTSATSCPRLPYSTDSPQPYSPQAGTFQQTQMPQQYTNQQQNNFVSQHGFTDPNTQGNYPGLNAQQAWDPFQQQPLLPQQTNRLDKTSILALYNYPQLAPPSQSNDANKKTNKNTEQQNSNRTESTVPQRSVTMPAQPVTMNKNPFHSTLKPPPISSASPPSIGRHVSQESADIGGFQNGRHSPDAFASLSARFVL